nr:metal-binding double selenoprotein MbdU [Desulfosporosinus sp. HMP52]
MCGQPLDYFSVGKEMTCHQCGKTEIGNIGCPNGHYVCDDCHGKHLFEFLLKDIQTTQEQNPFAIAEHLMSHEKVPMLGCENAWIAGGAFLAALKNEGTLTITDDQISEALHRTKRQAIGGYCGLTGICGIAPALGACFSVILGAGCPKDQETAKTMNVVGNIVHAIANLTGPCCCKAFVRAALTEAVASAQMLFNVSLAAPDQIVCTYSARHPHECRGDKCPYYKQTDNTTEILSILLSSKCEKYLKVRDSQNKWDEINESEHEFVTAEEQSYLEEVKAKGQFIDQDELLKELGINKDEIQY